MSGIRLPGCDSAVKRRLLLAILLLMLKLISQNTVSASDPHPAVASMLSEIDGGMVYWYVGQLSGEFPVLVGGEPYTIHTRNTFSGEPIFRATQFIFEHMESLGLTVTYQDWAGCRLLTANEISNRNVIAEKTGTSRADEIVVMTAHLDSAGSAAALFYGADDNASGSAAVLVAADLLSRHNLKRTIRFVLTTGEEQGLCGSQAYASMARSRNENIVAVYNLDMIGWDSNGSPVMRLHTRLPYEPGYARDLAIADTFTDVVGTYGLNLAPAIVSQSFGQSDHASFWSFGYPAILAIEDHLGDVNPFYHTTRDRLDLLNLQYLSDNVRASVGTIADLASITNTEVELTVPDGGTGYAETTGSSGLARSGYADLKVASGTDPYGIAVFAYSHDGVVVSEAGVPASPPTASARIFIDLRKGVQAVPAHHEAGVIDVNTGIAVVNYGSETADVTYTLRGIDGNPIATGHGNIGAGNHISCFVDQLADCAEAPDFSLPQDFATGIQYGSLEIVSRQPLSVLGLRGTINQRNDFLITATPVADLSQPPINNTISFPQFVDGGGYTTTIVLLNTSNELETGVLEIANAKGEPFVVNQAGGTADSSFKYSIAPGGIYRFQTDGFPAELKAGWLRLIPDTGTSTPVGSGVFGYNPDNILVSESGIPSAVSTNHARIYLDLSHNHNTGLALANLADTNTEIMVHVYEADGSTTAGSPLEPIRLDPKGYVAAFADQLTAELPAEFTGVLDIRSATPFAALTIRTLMNERHDFLMTAFPVGDANVEAPSPIVFPQIVEGGGYKTEFILISPTGRAGTTLYFHTSQGSPWSVCE
jgi:hypothetical protein